MATRAVLFGYTDIVPVSGPFGDEFMLTCSVGYVHEGGIGVDRGEAAATIRWGDSVQQVGSKVGDAIVALANQRGYTLDKSQGIIAFCTPQKGL